MLDGVDFALELPVLDWQLMIGIATGRASSRLPRRGCNDPVATTIPLTESNSFVVDGAPKESNFAWLHHLLRV